MAKKTPGLPKELTTVTPFSKWLALSLFVILPFFTFFLGMFYQQSQDEQVASQQKQISYSIPLGNPKSPQVVTQQFYTWYVDCLNKNTGQPTGNAAQNCNYQKNSSISPVLTTNMNAQHENLLCTANIPASVSTNNQKILGTQATVSVHQNFTGKTFNITAYLQKQKGVWKITNIICPTK